MKKIRNILVFTIIIIVFVCSFNVSFSAEMGENLIRNHDISAGHRNWIAGQQDWYCGSKTLQFFMWGFAPENAKAGYIYQDINVSNMAEDIDDAGSVRLESSFEFYKTLPHHVGNYTLIFYNSSGSELSRNRIKCIADAKTKKNIQFNLDSIPVGTRRIRVRFDAAICKGETENYVEIDNVVLKLKVLPKPQIGDLVDKTMIENETIQVNFRLSDPNDSLSDINLTAASSDESIIPNENLILSGVGENRILTIKGTGDSYGQSTISITADDGTYTTKRSLTLNVQDINQKPSFDDIKDVVLDENAGTKRVYINNITSGSQFEDKNQKLTFEITSSNEELINTPTVHYTTFSSSGYIELTPTEWKHGSSTITVTLKENGSENKVSKSFQVVVNEVISSEDALVDMTIDTGVLSPEYKSNIYDYSLNVSDTINNVGLTLTKLNPKAKIILEGNEVVSGEIQNILVEDGVNELTIELLSEDGVSKKTYNINIYRNYDTPPSHIKYYPNKAKMAVDRPLEIKFNENMAKGTGNIFIKNLKDDSIVKAIDVSDNNMVSINGDVVTIEYGVLESETDYYVEIENTCFKDLTGNFYSGIMGKDKWVIETEKSHINELENITVVNYKLEPDYNLNHKNYSIDVSKSVESVTINFSKRDDNSRVEVDGNEIDDKNKIVMNNLTEGNNEIQIKVTSEDDQVNIYTIDVFKHSFIEGIGTVKDPYKIRTIEEFLEIKNHSDKHYIQMNNLDFNVNNLDTVISSFSGVYDGNNKTIMNINMDYLIGGIQKDGVLKNLKLENIKIKSGGVVGQNSGTIKNLSIKGEMDDEVNGSVGGLCVHNNGVIEECSNYTSIKSNDNLYAGGICAINFGTIEACSNYGTIIGNSIGVMGGLVGDNREEGVISNSYNAGDIRCMQNNAFVYGIGGFCGRNSGEISHAYNTGNIYCKTQYSCCGLFCGKIDSVCNINCSLESSYTSGKVFVNGNEIQNPKVIGSGNGGVLLKNAEQMKQKPIFVGWDFNNIWKINEGVTYPKLLRESYIDITATTPVPIIEGEEDGKKILLSMLGGSFTNKLNQSDWEVNNLPTGVSIGSITRESDTEVAITLSGNRTADYDENIYLEVIIPSLDLESYQGSNIAINSGMTLQAVNDEERIIATYDIAIIEGEEDGEKILLSLSGGNFANELNQNNWKISNLPTGVSIGSVVRNSDTEATIMLSGNRTVDYDENITLEIIVPALDIDDCNKDITINPGVILNAINDIDPPDNPTKAVEINSSFKDGNKKAFIPSMTKEQLENVSLKFNIGSIKEAEITCTTKKQDGKRQSQVPFINVESADMTVSIPKFTTIQGTSDWDGTIQMPTVKDSSSVSVNGTSPKVIEVGASGQTLTFDKAVRLLIKGAKGHEVGFIKDGKYVPIKRTISVDNQETADREIPVGGEGKIQVGDDIVVWTKHFTEFVTYTPKTNDADLIDLAISTGSINSVFDKNKTEYKTAAVSYGVSNTSVTAAVSSSKSTMIIAINGKILGGLDSGVAKTVALKSGTNTITITITAEDNSKKKYTIIVNKQAPPSYDSQESEEYENCLIGKRMITSEEYRCWDEYKETLQLKDKVWSVKFNSPIDKKTVIVGDDYITVVDEDGYRMAIQLEYDEATNTLKIIPVNNYNTGKKYYLILGKKVKNVEGNNLNKPVRVEFTIKN